MNYRQILGDEDIKTMNKFIRVPMILFNDHKVICLNQKAVMLNIVERDLFQVYKQNAKRKNVNEKITVNKQDGHIITALLEAKMVSYKGKNYLLGEFLDITKHENLLKEAQRTSYARQLMLDMTHQLSSFEFKEDIYSYILDSSLKAVKKSDLCSIMIIENGYAKVVAKSGYSDDLYNLRYRLEDTFLYLATDGKMDCTANIPDLSIYYDKYYPSMTVANEEYLLKSTISAPIYVENKLFGLINIDGLEPNSFDEEDNDLLNLVRNNIEIALTNHFLYKKIEEMASHDNLTGLYNSAYFEKHFNEALIRNEPFFIVMFDLNNLKVVNDQLGHSYGDFILRNFSDKLREIHKENEIYARCGGDEFVGLFYEDSYEKMMERMEKLQSTLKENSICVEGHVVDNSFSYGIACYQEDGVTLRELLKRSDDLMYEYKRRYKENRR